jgi:hypothetical protein
VILSALRSAKRKERKLTCISYERDRQIFFVIKRKTIIVSLQLTLLVHHFKSFNIRKMLLKTLLNECTFHSSRT